MQDTTTASSNHYFSQWHQLWPSISLLPSHFESVPKNFLKVKKCYTHSKTSKSNGLYSLLQINRLYSILTLRPELRFTSDDGFTCSKNFYKTRRLCNSEVNFFLFHRQRQHCPTLNPRGILNTTRLSSQLLRGKEMPVYLLILVLQKYILDSKTNYRWNISPLICSCTSLFTTRERPRADTTNF